MDKVETFKVVIDALTEGRPPCVAELKAAQRITNSLVDHELAEHVIAAARETPPPREAIAPPDLSYTSLVAGETCDPCVRRIAALLDENDLMMRGALIIQLGVNKHLEKILAQHAGVINRVVDGLEGGQTDQHFVGI